MSEVSDQIADSTAQGFGNFDERVHGGRFLAAFDSTDKNGGQFGFLGQALLTKAGFLALRTNGLA